jgi:sugar phosphate isomerase/epimerase
MTERSKPHGLSLSEEELFEHFSSHGRTEGAILAEYERLVADADADWVSYMGKLILEEETRHHQVFEELANSLRASVERDAGPVVPFVTRVASPSELLGATERLLKAEERDARELKRLARKLRDRKGLSLWPLLVELMQRDTEKHQVILGFMRDRLRAQIRSAR